MYFDKRPSCFRNLLHEIICVSVICCSLLLLQAALGNIIIPLSIIGPAIGITDVKKLPWTVAAYSLTGGAFILITGRLGDVFGHKLLLIIGYAIFSVSSLLAGMAAYVKNDTYFDVMRAFQGIGVATLIPNAVGLLARAYPAGQRKSLVFAVFGMTVPLGFIMGALFGSIFAQLLWWPWGQWVLAIVCAILAISAYFVIPVELAPAVEPKGKIDIPGSIIGIMSLILFIYSWNQGPVSGWDKPYVYALLIVSIVLAGIFIFVEMKTKEPIMPLSLWSVKGFPGVLACIALGWSSYGIYMFYTVQFLQVIRGTSPLLTTAMLSPIVISGLAATISLSFLYGRVPAHFLLMASMLFFCISNILIATMPADQTYWAQVFISTLFMPFAINISFPAASLIVSNTMPIHQQGVAASMINMIINWSVSLGLGLAGTLESELRKRGRTVLEGYRGGLYVGIALGGVGVFVALLFCRVPTSSTATGKEKSQIDALSTKAASDEVISMNTAKDEGFEETTPILRHS